MDILLNPLLPDISFWVFYVIALVLLAGLWGIWWFLSKKQNLPGVTGLNVLKVLSALLTPIWFVVVVGLITYLWNVLTAPQPKQAEDLRWVALTVVGLITALGGLVGAPLALIRVFTTERQTKAQEEGLITDRINNAVRNLGATRQFSVKNSKDRLYPSRKGTLSPGRMTWDTPEIISSELWAPNIEVRVGAILELERLAQSNLEVHVQIMEILCSYIRENSRDSTVTIDRRTHELEEDETHLRRARSDIFAAVGTLTRRNIDQINAEKEAAPRFRIDLRFSNLSYCNMSHGDFSAAILIGCEMTETLCVKTNFSEAFLNDATATLVGIETSNFHKASTDPDNLNRLNIRQNLTEEEFHEFERNNPPAF